MTIRRIIRRISAGNPIRAEPVALDLLLCDMVKKMSALRAGLLDYRNVLQHELISACSKMETVKDDGSQWGKGWEKHSALVRL